MKQLKSELIKQHCLFDPDVFILREIFSATRDQVETIYKEIDDFEEGLFIGELVEINNILYVVKSKKHNSICLYAPI